MTQQLIAEMLGVRRGGVIQTAGHVQSAGLITCRREHITVLNRPNLEKWGCECYAEIAPVLRTVSPHR